MSPMGQFRDWEDCIRSAPAHVRDKEAYCGSIKHKVEDKMQKAVDSASYLRQSVRAAVEAVIVKHDTPKSPHKEHMQGGRQGVQYTREDELFDLAYEIYGHGNYNPRQTAALMREQAPDASDDEIEQSIKAMLEGEDVRPLGRIRRNAIRKAHDPVKEAGKKKLTAKDGVANEGAQDDQPFAVAFGPDNYDQLTKTLIAAPYQQGYDAAGTILKALENKQFNFPGNIEEHMKKAHAAIHGREMWDARYSDVCDLITQARKILHSIEKTAEVSQGGSGMMVVGKADPGQEEKAKPTVGTQPFKRPRTQGQKLRTAAARESTQATHYSGGKYRSASGKPLPYQKARGGMGVSGAGGVAKPGWAQTKQPIPDGARKPSRIGTKRPGAATIPSFYNKAAREAVQKAIKAVRGR